VLEESAPIGPCSVLAFAYSNCLWKWGQEQRDQPGITCHILSFAGLHSFNAFAERNVAVHCSGSGHRELWFCGHVVCEQWVH
jgi:hypothetical protein